MNIQKQRDFLTRFAYWSIIAAGIYLGFEYLLPVSVPFLIGIFLAWVVVWISRKVHCSNKYFRLLLTLVIYGVVALLVILLAARAISGITALVQWIPQVYENKLLPIATMVYDWFTAAVHMLNPALLSTLETVLDGAMSALKDLVTYLSGAAVNLVSGLVTGIPNLILSLLTMIFSTVFVVSDYERIAAFASCNVPEAAKKVLTNIRIYLTDTLFVVIRSYVLIMLLTFAELSILFTLFGIENAVLKAAIIALLDILPILGTGGIMIPWAVTSLVLGYTKLGLELFLIYGIVTVIRNYVEPKIVGTQLGLHPIITLVSMFIGLRLFGFWGLFGLPVGISFLWKQKKSAN